MEVKCGGLSESESKKREGKKKDDNTWREVEGVKIIRTIKSMGDIWQGHMDKERELMKIKVTGKETNGMLDG